MRHRDAGPDRLAEPGQGNLDVIGTGEHVGEVVVALTVGHGVAGEVGFLADDRDGGTGDVGPLRIRDRSNDAAVKNLGVDGRCDCDAGG